MKRFAAYITYLILLFLSFNFSFSKYSFACCYQFSYGAAAKIRGNYLGLV